MHDFWAELAVIALMLVFNAAFAAYEMALAAVPKAHIRHLKEKNVPGAATGGAGINEYLVPVLSARYGLTAWAAEAAGIVLFVLPLTTVTIVFGELVPKVFAMENRELILLNASPFFTALHTLFYPLLFVFERTVKSVMGAINLLLPSGRRRGEKAALAELRNAAAQARDESLIGGMQERIVNAAAELGLRKVEELLIPLSAVSSIPSDMSLTQALIRAHMDLHTRFPVTRTDWNASEIIGYLNFKDIVNALKMKARSPDAAGITRPIEKVRAGTRSRRLLSASPAWLFSRIFWFLYAARARACLHGKRSGSPARPRSGHGEMVLTRALGA